MRTRARLQFRVGWPLPLCLPPFPVSQPAWLPPPAWLLRLQVRRGQAIGCGRAPAASRPSASVRLVSSLLVAPPAPCAAGRCASRCTALAASSSRFHPRGVCLTLPPAVGARPQPAGSGMCVGFLFAPRCFSLRAAAARFYLRAASVAQVYSPCRPLSGTPAFRDVAKVACPVAVAYVPDVRASTVGLRLLAGSGATGALPAAVAFCRFMRPSGLRGAVGACLHARVTHQHHTGC